MPTYTIKRGDTLSNIAAQNGMTVQQLLQANPSITNPDLIYEGSILNIPNQQQNPPQGQPAPAETTVSTGSDGQFNGSNIKEVLRDYYGVDPALLDKYPDEVWNRDIGPVATYIKTRAEKGEQLDEINTANFFDAYQAAANDPTIQSVYGDQLKLDKAGLFQNLNYLNTLYGVDKATQERNFRKQQEALQETEAQAGRAYSGFRGQAQKDLNEEQQGIVTSKRAQVQKSIFDVGSQYEKAYGTKDLGQFGDLTYGGQTYKPIGGITGQIPLQKEQDIVSKQGEIRDLMATPQ